MKEKRFILLVIYLLLTMQLFAQSNYYKKDTTSAVGIKMVDGGELTNAQFCQIENDEGIIKYTPYEVKEYGFKDGRVYVAYDITINGATQRVFLEQLVEGDLSLFYYRGKDMKTFFLKKGKKELTELPRRDENNPKESFQSKLKEFTSDYYYAANVTKLVKYNKRSLTKFVDGYNKRDLPLFTLFRFGVSFGYGGSKLIAPPPESNEIFSYKQNPGIENINYQYEKNFVGGIFIDIPFSGKGFSLNTGLYYTSNSFSYNKFVDSVDMDFLGKTSSIEVPLLLRYTLQQKKIKPFFESGLCLLHYLENETHLYEALFTNNLIEIEEEKEHEGISNNQIGFSVGGGIEYKLNHRNSLFFEFRYDRFYNLSKDKTLNNSTFSFAMGFNF